MKIISLGALALMLGACSSIDITGLGDDQIGLVNVGDDVSTGYIVQGGEAFQVQADGSLVLVSNDQLPDIDGDEIPDILDPDIDGDGIDNVKDSDIDGDGIINQKDTDIDGDGVANIDDIDIDGDGEINTADLDIDGDGIDNVNDLDTDGDGVIDAIDNDIDGDGIANVIDPDTDGDGIENTVDSDIDGDGIENIADNDIDGDGVENTSDVDQDGDGILDVTEDPVDVIQTDEVDGSLSVTASTEELIDLAIIKGQVNTTEPSTLNLIDIRQEVLDNNMQLSTVQISNIKISAPNANSFSADMGTTGTSITATRDGVVLFQSAVTVTVEQLVSGLSSDEGTLQVSPVGMQAIENEVKNVSGTSDVLIDIELTLDSAPMSNYSVQVVFEVVTNGKAETDL